MGLIRKGIGKIFGDGFINNPGGTLMERMVAEQTIPYKNKIYELGKTQFENNLREIYRNAKQAGVPVITSELISNTLDQEPFVSVETENYPPAKEVFEEALQLLQQQKIEDAQKAFYLAKDLDALRFRAPEEFNEIIHRVSREFAIPVVPMKHYFESASPFGINGNTLFLEHLHPNIDGYFLMADAFFEILQKNKFIDLNWNIDTSKSASYYRKNWGFTELDSAVGDIRIRVLKGGWPFKPKSVPNKALMNYLPATKAESLAVKVWLEEDITLEKGHVEIAEYYEKHQNYEAAYREYKALICLTPLNISPYLRAADNLIKLGKFDLALPLLRKSLTIEETAFATKWIGQILLLDYKVKESLTFLEKAQRYLPGDPQVLYNLSGAYALSQQFNKADVTLNKLYQINPKFPGAKELRVQVNNILNK